MVNFTSTRKDERKTIQFLLEELKITSHDYDERFSLRIFGFDNLKKLVEAGIFEYHPERNEKLNNGFEKLKNSLKIL